MNAMELYDDIVSLFSQISTTENNIEETTRLIATNHDVGDGVNDVIVDEVGNYLTELDQLSRKYSEFRSRFADELRDSGGNERLSVDIYEKLLELVILQQENLAERIVRVQDYLTQIRGGLSRDVIERFSMIEYSARDQEEDNDVCCICLSSRAMGDRIMVLPCGHRYHDNCSRRMFEAATFCAICGRNFST